MPKRLYFNDSDPICDQAARLLLESYGEGECPDLGRVLVCLPGKLARIMLIRALAEKSPRGLLSPEIMTAGALLHMGEHGVRRPNDFEEQLLWYETVVDASGKRAGEFHTLFPCGAPPVPNLPAEQFRTFRNELVRNNLSISEVAEKYDPTNQDRGKELAELERIYLEKIEKGGFTDSLAADRELIRNTDVFGAYDKIILLNMPDLPKAVRMRMENVEIAMPGKVEVWIGAPEIFGEDYDEWGCVKNGLRNKRCIDLPSPNVGYEYVLTPEDMARRALEIARVAGDGQLLPDETAILLADSSLLPAFQNEFGKAELDGGGKIAVYDPNGIAMSALRMCRVGMRLCDLLSHPDDFSAVVAYYHDPDVLHYFSHKYRIGENRMLCYSDGFEQNYHLDELTAAIMVAKRQHDAYTDEYRKETAGAFLKMLEEISGLNKDFLNKDISLFLSEYLTGLYLHRKDLEEERTLGVLAASEIEILRKHLAELADWNGRKQNGFAWSERDAKLFILKLFWQNLGKVTIPMVPEHNGYPVEGCLEIPFLPQKHVIFCGFNDCWYPDRLPVTPFLNEGIRERLGLRGNDTSFSRAICYVRSMIRSRLKEGCSVHFLTAGMNVTHDTLKPSQLYFCGDVPDEELMARVKMLFKEEPKTVPEPVRATDGTVCSFTIRPDLHFKTERGGDSEMPVLSVTDFKEYLVSPLRFFFSRVLRMERMDYLSHEMDAQDFGTICHDILYRCGDRLGADAEFNRKLLIEEENVVFRRKYGAKQPALVRLQKEILEQRLASAAVVFADAVEDGYEPVALEYEFGGPERRGIEFHGALLRGKADRIEYNRTKGIIRIVDYKTGSVDKVQDEHYTIKKGVMVFTNLQLPLYVLLLRNDPYFRTLFDARYPGLVFDDIKIETAYFMLPKAVMETNIVPWTAGEMKEILPAAEEEATRIIGEIKDMTRGILHENPDGRPKYDSFGDLLLPDTRSAVRGVTWNEEK